MTGVSKRATCLPLLAATTLVAGVARADAPSTVDIVEHIFGASNTNAVAGHGGLTAGFSADGDLTLLSWPGPTFADQLAYLSSKDRKSTRLNSSHLRLSRMPSSA